MELSKESRKELRLLLGLGHERLLSSELRQLEYHFAAWKAGEIDAFDLTEHIHVFHNGPSRDINSRFTMRGLDSVMVAGLFVEGVLKEADISTSLLAAISPEIESIKSFRGE